MEVLKHWLESRKTDDNSILLLLIQGYFYLTVLCFIILILPVSQLSENTVVDQIFFAVSIVSTTGLVPSDFGSSYNMFGQIVSLLFIQLGGIGYMALITFIVLKRFDKLPRLSARLLKQEFHLPQKYPLLSFIYSVIIFTLIFEIIGAIVLYFGFRNAGVENPVWNAIFHSVSAFCTAGFSLFGDSMSSFKGNSLITTTILILSLLGSIGFIVLLDFWMKFLKHRKTITLTSKIILFSTFLFWIVGSFMIFFSDTTLMGNGWNGLKIAAFQSISAHTTVGFNNYDISAISPGGIYIMIILMIIGASPAGTGGGIKTTSITAIIAVLLSVLRRRNRITFFSKEIPTSNIYLAISSALFYVFIMSVGLWLLLLTDGAAIEFEELLFEASSALSTVGISTGITGDLSDQGKLIIASLMFIGRLGVLTFGFALMNKAPLLRNKPKSEDIAI